MTVADVLLTAAIPAGLVYLILTRRLSGEQRRARQAIADAKAAQAAIAATIAQTATKAHRAGVQTGYRLGVVDGYREAVNRTTRDATVARLLEGVAL